MIFAICFVKAIKVAGVSYSYDKGWQKLYLIWLQSKQTEGLAQGYHSLQLFLLHQV